MAAKFTEVEVYVIVDESGDYAVGSDLEAAVERYGEELGDMSESQTRTICVKIKVPTPATATITAELPPEGDPIVGVKAS